MSHPKGTDAEVMELVRRYGKTEAAKRLGVHIRNINARCRNLEQKYGQDVTPPHHNSHNALATYPGVLQFNIQSGSIIIGSDAHIEPGPPSTAMRAFVHFIKEMKPKCVILNGDVMDFPRISKHSPIGWEKMPEPAAEIEAAQEQLYEIEKAAGRVEKIWTLGNHDARFESTLHRVAPDYARINGVHLKDHFPLWSPCWRVDINKDVVVKHRFKGGIHATHNNVLWGGKSFITGHLHSLQVRPFSDYTENIKWGVDTGCLADVGARAFLDYTEAGPKNWRSGFVVLTFHKGVLLQPELVIVYDDNHVQFRGSLIKV